jgi:biotin carboxylase
MKKKKKILMLGGSDIQVSAIKKAGEMGYYVITCDYLPDNPGHKFSDEYHNVSTTEKEKVLRLARDLNVDGILAYASDPAALTAAYVGEKMGLFANPYKAVKILSRKDLFRKVMKQNDFLVPDAKAVISYKEASDFAASINKPVIIKPVDSSGSKGVYKIEAGEDFEDKFHSALSFSRVGGVIIEEFITKKGFQIGGDGFMVDGNLAFRCFGDIHFSKTNPLLPCSVSVPTLHNAAIVEKAHQKVQDLLGIIGMKVGGLNFDIMVDEEENIYILEIGARNGGNMIPELTRYCTGVDMIELSIKAAMGEDISGLSMTHEKKYFSHYVIHADKNGIIQSVQQSELLKKRLLHEHFNFNAGDEVQRFESSANRLGILLLQYANKKEMLDIIYHMDEHLMLKIKDYEYQY